MPEDARPAELELAYDELADWPVWFEGARSEEWSRDVLGLSVELIDELRSWQRECVGLYVEDLHVPVGAFEWSHRRQVLLDRGKALTERLRVELPETAIVFRPLAGFRTSADDADDTAPRAPTEIRLMWDHCVTWPLWGPLGALSPDRAYVRETLGLSDALAADLRAWARAAEDYQVLDPPQDEESEMRRKESLDRWAGTLVERMRQQLPDSVSVRYHP